MNKTATVSAALGLIRSADEPSQVVLCRPAQHTAVHKTQILFIVIILDNLLFIFGSFLAPVVFTVWISLGFFAVNLINETGTSATRPIFSLSAAASRWEVK